MAEIVNASLRSMGQSEEVKKLRKKLNIERSSNVNNLQIPKDGVIAFQTKVMLQMQRADSSGQFILDLTVIVQLFEMIVNCVVFQQFINTKLGLMQIIL